MSELRLVLTGIDGTSTVADGIAAFVLDKEMYTPYSQLHLTAYGNFPMQVFRRIYRVKLLLGETILHYGTVEQLRLSRENGTSFVRLNSRGLTAMLLQNQLEPGLHSGMSLDGLMTAIPGLPSEITWEANTDTGNYLYVKENTSLWDGVANLTYKLCERYPFIYGANEVRMHLPSTYSIFHPADGNLLAAGTMTDQSRIYSDFYMADADGTYGKFHETTPEAAALGIVRTRQLALDRQYLYDPGQALVFRRKFAMRGLFSYFFDYIGALEANLGDRLTYGTVVENGVVNHIRMTGDRRGIRTRLETYQDGFYP